jgi:hypothetical protein
MNCWHCSSELIWGGDHDYEDICREEPGIVSNLSCPDCNTYVEVYHTMTEEGQRGPAEIRESGLKRFNELYRAKWDKGQREHGGCLDETVTVESMEEEVLDFWGYLQSLKEKHRKEVESLKQQVDIWKDKYRDACKN